MNVFNKITRKNLKQNKTRTLVTIVGIILSMAMFTAVIEGATSGIEFLRNSVIAKEGCYTGIFNNLSKEDLNKIKTKKEIKQSAVWQDAGWSKISEEDDSPYFSLKSIDKDFTKLVAVNIIAGRMPKNSTEIIIPKSTNVYSKSDYRIGNELRLSFGKITANGNILSDDMANIENEQIIDSTSKIYKIVGIYEDFNSPISNHKSPSFQFLTLGSVEDGSYSLFFQLKNPYTTNKFIKAQNISNNYDLHTGLLELYGVVNNSGIQKTVAGLSSILIIIIAFCAISLIHNAFSISVSERTKLFGILKSVGATKKQIRSSVLYEAFILSSIGIPVGFVSGCAGLGITFYFLQDVFKSFTSGNNNTKLTLIPNVPALIISSVICLITILISAWIPAKKAVKIPAIEAIRQTNDIKIKGKNVKTSKLTQKLFGFEGMIATKNFKVSKKRYRATIFSLFLSIVLFITTSSFTSTLSNSVKAATKDTCFQDISFYTYLSAIKESPDEFLKKLNSIETIQRKTYFESISVKFSTKTENINTKEKELFPDTAKNETTEFMCNVIFLQDDEFKNICKENGIHHKIYFDKSNKTFPIYCNKTIKKKVDKNSSKYHNYDYFNKTKLPIELKGNFIEENEKNITIATPFTFKADKIIKEGVLGIQSNNPYFICPFSMREQILNGITDVKTLDDNGLSFNFTAKNHKEAFNSIEKLLIDQGINSTGLVDSAQTRESSKMFVMLIKVFSYGFVTLISLISITNIFNTITTNVILRRREFAMLKSIGLSNKSFKKMMRFECLIYGIKSLVLGLPTSILIYLLIKKAAENSVEMSATLPYTSIIISVLSVFVVIFITMFYAVQKIKKDNPIDALKNENI